jgi:hypothetical protein
MNNIKNLALLLNASVSLGFGILFCITMLISKGRASIDMYHEGWVETFIFLCIGVWGFVVLRQNHP